VCRAGFGGAACDVCGGDKPNYGPGTRPIGTACVECPGIGGADGGGGVGGFQFLDPKGGKNWFTPRVIAAIAATNPSECIGEFTQIVDDAWSLAPQVRGRLQRALVKGVSRVYCQAGHVDAVREPSCAEEIKVVGDLEMGQGVKVGAADSCLTSDLRGDSIGARVVVAVASSLTGAGVHNTGVQFSCD
jgi:hypothetical protein